MTQKTGTLHRMRTSGWFDILIAVLVLALVIGAAALIGQISYLVAAKGYTEDMGQYERTQALNWFARSRSSFARRSTRSVVRFSRSRAIAWTHPSIHARR